MCFSGDIFGAEDPVRENEAIAGLKGLVGQKAGKDLEDTYVVELTVSMSVRVLVVVGFTGLHVDMLLGCLYINSESLGQSQSHHFQPPFPSP